MFMKTIILTGCGGSGKTTTLKDLHQKLLDQFNVIQVPNAFLQHPNGDDIYDEVVTQKGQKIGIITMGDNYYTNHGVGFYFNRAKKDKCDWFVCANSFILHNYILFDESIKGYMLMKGALTDGDQNRIIHDVVKILTNERAL